MRFLLLFLGSATIALAQTAEITGQITDPSGANVPGAAVTVTNTDTGIRRAVTSNINGFYTLPLLRPGPYRIAVEKTGFQPAIRESVRLQVDEVLRLDFPLQVGPVNQAVEVAGAAPLKAGLFHRNAIRAGTQ